MISQHDISALEYPLDVYAEILRLDYGEVDSLHYGLFSSPDEGIISAQKRHTEFLLKRIPAAANHILDVGIGTGATLYELDKLGYKAVGVTPDSSQIAIALSRGTDLDIEHSRFEDLQYNAIFDVVLFQESSQYIKARDIFSGLQKYCMKGSLVLILDEFNSNPEYGLQLKSDILKAADEFSFALMEDVNLTLAATPTLTYLLNAISRYGRELSENLGIPGARLEQLRERLQHYKRCYETGDYQYGCLTLVAP